MKRIIFIHITCLLLVSLAFSSFSYSQKEYGPYGKTRKVKLTNRDKLINELSSAEEIFETNAAKAIKIVEKVILKAGKKNEKHVEAVGFKTLGYFNTSLGNHVTALSYFDKAIPLLKKENIQWGLKNAYGYASTSAKALKKYALANNYLTSLQPYLKKENNPTAIADNLLNIAENQLLLDQLNGAEQNYQTCVTYSKENRLPEQEIAAEIGLSRVLSARKEFDKSRVQLEQTKSKISNSGNVGLNNSYYDELSNVSKNTTTNSSEYLQIQQDAFTYNIDVGNNGTATQNSINASNSLIALNRPKEALEVLEKSIDLPVKPDELKVKKELFETLGKLYEAEGKIEKAEEIKKQYNTILDSFAINESNKLLALQAKNELLDNAQNKVLLLEKDRELRDKEILLLRKDKDLQEETIKRQRIITYSLGFGILAIAILSFFIYKNNREKNISNQLLVLKSLRNQMNPHFIFNSLNSVNSFIAQQDERAANKYLAEFSKLMREVLEYSQEDFIPLAKEIDILKIYLNLEYFRFKDAFDFTFEVDPVINQEDYLIPPMLLQPFIENAIWHGLRYKKEKGKLDVTFKQKKDFISILIKDNGIGREQSKLLKTTNQKKMKSTGLKNVESRLEIIKNVFKKTLEVDIKDINQAEETGTEVTIKLF